jgi:hypothetical protein
VKEHHCIRENCQKKSFERIKVKSIHAVAKERIDFLEERSLRKALEKLTD